MFAQFLFNLDITIVSKDCVYNTILQSDKNIWSSDISTHKPKICTSLWQLSLCMSLWQSHPRLADMSSYEHKFRKCWNLPSLFLNVFDFINGKLREEHPSVHLASHHAWIGKNIIQCKYSCICHICKLRTNTCLSGLHVFFRAFPYCGSSCGSSTYTSMHILAMGLHKLDLLLVARKVILVVAFAFFDPNFEKLAGTYQW